MGGRRWTWMEIGWVDIDGWTYRMGGVDIGWVSFCCVVVVARRDRVRRSVVGHAGQATEDAGSHGQASANAHIIPCPLSTSPHAPAADRSDQRTFFVGGGGIE